MAAPIKSSGAGGPHPPKSNQSRTQQATPKEKPATVLRIRIPRNRTERNHERRLSQRARLAAKQAYIPRKRANPALVKERATTQEGAATRRWALLHRRSLCRRGKPATRRARNRWSHRSNRKRRHRGSESTGSYVCELQRPNV
jgi:hypothetical protein